MSYHGFPSGSGSRRRRHDRGTGRLPARLDQPKLALKDLSSRPPRL